MANISDRHIILTENVLSLDEAFQFVNHPSLGGNCLFVGTVRGKTKDVITEALEFESFEAMARSEISKIIDEIQDQYPESRIFVSHRLGKTQPGEVVVIIAVGTPHRDAAFAACRHGIDRLKETVPIWKKEILEDGSFWVNSTP